MRLTRDERICAVDMIVVRYRFPLSVCLCVLCVCPANILVFIYRLLEEISI